MSIWIAFENFTIKMLGLIMAGLVLAFTAMLFLIIAIALMFPIWGFIAVVVLLLRVL